MKINLRKIFFILFILFVLFFSGHKVNKVIVTKLKNLKERTIVRLEENLNTRIFIEKVGIGFINKIWAKNIVINKKGGYSDKFIRVEKIVFYYNIFDLIFNKTGTASSIRSINVYNADLNIIDINKGHVKWNLKEIIEKRLLGNAFNVKVYNGSFIIREYGFRKINAIIKLRGNGIVQFILHKANIKKDNFDTDIEFSGIYDHNNNSPVFQGNINIDAGINGIRIPDIKMAVNGNSDSVKFNADKSVLSGELEIHKNGDIDSELHLKNKVMYISRFPFRTTADLELDGTFKLLNYSGNISSSFSGLPGNYIDNLQLIISGTGDKVSLENIKIKNGDGEIKGYFIYDKKQSIPELEFIIRDYPLKKDIANGKININKNQFRIKNFKSGNLKIKKYLLNIVRQGNNILLKTVDTSIPSYINGEIKLRDKPVLDLNVVLNNFEFQGYKINAPGILIKGPPDSIKITSEKLQVSKDRVYNIQDLYYRNRIIDGTLVFNYAGRKLFLINSVKIGNKSYSIMSKLVINNNIVKINGGIFKEGSEYRFDIYIDDSMKIMGSSRRMNFVAGDFNAGKILGIEGLKMAGKFTLKNLKHGAGEIEFYNEFKNNNVAAFKILYRNKKIDFNNIQLFAGNDILAGKGEILNNKLSFNLSEKIKVTGNLNNRINVSIRDLEISNILQFINVNNKKIYGNVSGSISVNNISKDMNINAALRSPQIKGDININSFSSELKYYDKVWRLKNASFSTKYGNVKISSGYIKNSEGIQDYQISGVIKPGAHSTGLYSIFKIRGSTGNFKVARIELRNNMYNNYNIPDLIQRIVYNDRKIVIENYTSSGIKGFIKIDDNYRLSSIKDINLKIINKNSVTGKISAVQHGNSDLSGIRIYFPILSSDTLNFLYSGITKSSGNGSLDIVISKLKTNPQIKGNFMINAGKIRFERGRIFRKLDNLTMDIEFLNDYVKINNISGNVKNEGFNIAGDIELNGLIPDEMSLIFKTDGDKGFPVNFNNGDYLGKISGNLEIAGSFEKPEFTGKLLLFNADFTAPFKKAKRKSFIKSSYLDIDFVAGRNLHYYNNRNDIDIEIKPDGILNLDGDFHGGDFSLTGVLESKNGRLEYLNTGFTIKEAKVTFSDIYDGYMPYVDGRAEARVKDDSGKDVYIELRIRDILDEDLKPILTSTPFHTREELFYLLSFGKMIKNYDPFISSEEESDEIERFLTAGILTYFDDAYQDILIKPFERRIKRILGLDLLKIRPKIIQNILDNDLYVTRDGQTVRNPVLDSLDNSEIIMGKYLFSNLFITYTLVLKTTDASSALNYEHQLGLKWSYHFIDFSMNWKPVDIEHRELKGGVFDYEVKIHQRF